MPSSLYAISDLHVSYARSRDLVDRMEAGSADDWLLVGGDVADRFEDVERTLRLLRDRFGTVVWAPATTRCCCTRIRTRTASRGAPAASPTPRAGSPRSTRRCRPSC